MHASEPEPGIVGNGPQRHITGQAAIDWLRESKESVDRLRLQDIAERIGSLATPPPRVHFRQVTITRNQGAL
ncbi:hypothetical protein ACWEP8_33815 [Streptomyces hydrogenans]